MKPTDSATTFGQLARFSVQTTQTPPGRRTRRDSETKCSRRLTCSITWFACSTSTLCVRKWPGTLDVSCNDVIARRLASSRRSSTISIPKTLLALMPIRSATRDVHSPSSQPTPGVADLGPQEAHRGSLPDSPERLLHRAVGGCWRHRASAGSWSRGNGVRNAGRIEPVGVDHHHDEPLEVDLRIPAQDLSRLGRVADQEIDLGRAHERRVDTTYASVEAHVVEGDLDETLHRVGLARGDDVVVRLVLLEHEPHRLDVVAGEAPVALRVEVAEREFGRARA